MGQECNHQPEGSDYTNQSAAAGVCRVCGWKIRRIVTRWEEDPGAFYGPRKPPAAPEGDPDGGGSVREYSPGERTGLGDVGSPVGTPPAEQPAGRASEGEDDNRPIDEALEAEASDQTCGESAGAEGCGDTDRVRRTAQLVLDWATSGKDGGPSNHMIFAAVMENYHVLVNMYKRLGEIERALKEAKE